MNWGRLASEITVKTKIAPDAPVRRNRIGKLHDVSWIGAQLWAGRHFSLVAAGRDFGSNVAMQRKLPKPLINWQILLAPRRLPGLKARPQPRVKQPG